MPKFASGHRIEEAEVRSGLGARLINELRKVSLHRACSFDRMGGSLLVRGAEREGHKQYMEARIRLIRKEVETHYLQSRESQRLSGDRGELERLRTQAILGRSLPPAPATRRTTQPTSPQPTFIAPKTWQPKFMLAVSAMSRSLRSKVRFGVPLCSTGLGTTRYSERA